MFEPAEVKESSALATAGEDIACPRCGYDLRGTVRAWSDHCPLEGTCAECGLQFEWSHVLMIAKFEPRWCVEFATDWIRVPRACAVTFVRSWFPWRFWRSMHMPSRVRWRRLAVYLGVMVLAIVLPYVAVQSARAVMVRNYINDSQGSMVQQQLPAIAILEEQIAAAESGLYDQERYRISREEYIAELRIEIQNIMIRAQFTPPSISLSYIEVIVEALLHPLSETSRGTITIPDGSVVPYLPPAEYTMALYFSIPNQNPWAPPPGSGHRPHRHLQHRPAMCDWRDSGHRNRPAHHSANERAHSADCLVLAIFGVADVAGVLVGRDQALPAHAARVCDRASDDGDHRAPVCAALAGRDATLDGVMACLKHTAS